MRVVESHRHLDRRTVRSARVTVRRAAAADSVASRIVEAVAAVTGVGVGALQRPDGVMRGPHGESYARHLLMWALSEWLHMGPVAIGRLTGGRDHSTVAAGVRRIAMERRTRHETWTDGEAVRRLVQA